MRTIAILFVLAVIGAALPAASLGHGLLPTAVLLFACALAGLLAACLVSGWLLCERRTLGRMTGESPILVPSPAAQPTPARTWSVTVPHGAMDHSTAPRQRFPCDGIVRAGRFPIVSRSTPRG